MSEITERRLREIEDTTKRPGVKMTQEFLYIRELVGEVRRLKKRVEELGTASEKEDEFTIATWYALEVDEPTPSTELPSAVFVYDDGRRVDAIVKRIVGRIYVHIPIPAEDAEKGHLESHWVSTGEEATFSAVVEVVNPDDLQKRITR